MAGPRHPGARPVHPGVGPRPADWPPAGAAGPCQPPGARPARGHRRAAPVRRGGLTMKRLPLRATQGGFTLVEVLVAGLQATSALTHNAQRQSDVLLAHLCAENELIKTRLSRQMPDIGDSTQPCEQAGRRFDVSVIVRPTPNPSFRRVDAQVLDGTLPVLRLSTIVGRR